MNVTPEAIWQDVQKRARSYFHVSLNCKSIDEVCAAYKIQKASLLRDVCLKNGIQIHLRNYDLQSKNKLPFTDEVSNKKLIKSE
jgi:protein TIF31